MAIYKDIAALAFGFALLINAILFIPQAMRIWKEKTAKSVSLITFLGFWLTQLTIVIHGIIKKDYILATGYLLSMVTCGGVIFLAIYFRRTQGIDAGDESITYEEVLRQLPGHIYWKNKEGITMGCNTQNWQDFGFKSLDDYIGNTDYDILPKEQAKEIIFTDQEVIRTGKPFILEESSDLSDGATALFLSHKVPLKNRRGEVVGVAGVSFDITSTKKEIIDKLAFFDNIISLMPGHVYWVDRDGIYQGCNDAQAKSSGLSDRAEIIGKRNKDLPWNCNAKAIPEMIDKVNQDVMEAGTTMVIEEPAELSDGTKAVFLSSKVPIKNKDNRVVGMVGISIDITNSKIQEKELEESKAKADQANKAKTEFLYNMRHDIRTPFSGILGLAQLMARKETDPVKKESLEMIEQSSETLLLYLNEILEFMQIESGEIPVLLKHFSFYDLIQSTTNTFQPNVYDKPITLQFNYEDLPHWLIGDQFRLQRILINLISNAIKFTDEGSITVSASLIEKNGKDALVRLSVSDTGIGIPEEKQAIIFEHFTKVGGSYDTTNAGMGLGLRAVKSLVKELGGEVFIDSAEGQGTSFSCVLPMEVSLVSDSDTLKKLSGSSSKTAMLDINAMHKAISDKASALEQSNTVNKNTFKALLVEDSRIAQLAGMSLLAAHGFSVDVAKTAAQAIEQFKQKHYDMLFLDIGLPDANGYDVAEKLRAYESSNHKTAVPIIVLTAHVDENNYQQHNAVVDDFVQKPLTVDAILSLQNRYLKNQSRFSSMIDWDTCIQLYGDPETAKHVINEFLSDMPYYYDKLSADLDFQALSQVSGNLIGEASYCGVQAVVDAATQLKQYCEAADQAGVSKSLDALRALIKMLMNS